MQAIEFEKKYRKPAIPVALAEFEEQLTGVARFRGMPGIRVQYIQGPVWAKTAEQLRKAVVFGNNPLTGKPVMQEIVDKLTRPLSPEDTKTGQIEREMGPATYTGTAAELQQLYLEKRYTDFMPIILPTEELVNEMLKATSHEPDEPLGRMFPGSGAGETWTYTVKVAAINAVMAGAKPQYFPVILALGSTGSTAINVSDNGFAAAAVINGDIRDEIGLNYDVGAVGPYAHANVAIGRAWNLLSINGGNCGKVGTTYMGTVGNAQNALATIIAENEEKSPFQPLSVRKGFQKGENVVTLFSGWGILSAKNWKVNAWETVMDYPKMAKAIHDGQTPGLFGTVLVLSPPIADFIADDGYDTVEKFTEYVTGASAKPKPKGKFGGFNMGPGFQVIVTGASNNNYWMAGGLREGQSITIDDWR